MSTSIRDLTSYRSGLVIAGAALFAGSASAGVCPPVGADSDCAIVISITDTGATISYTGQGPFDTIEDTLVGVVNNSKQPVHSIIVRSLLRIFAFDGDGICGISPITGAPYTPRPAGCPFGATTYEGPGVSFSNVSSDLKSGTVNFNVPLAANGGSAYFSLEEAISAAYSCPDLINNAVKPVASGANINATFTPNLGLTLQQAAQYCGFTDFNWTQQITRQDDPSLFYARNLNGAFDASVNGPVRLASARTPYADPPQGGGYTYTAAPDFSYPFYYDRIAELPGHKVGGVTLTFHDAPADPCLPGGGRVGTPDCDNSAQPAGSYGAYSTRLAGINADGTATDLGIGFNWTSDYNGTTGGTQIKKTDAPADGNGTGGVTITSVQNVTNYQYNGIVVTAVNGTPIPATVDTTPPSVTVAATPAQLWPPNGKMVSVTIAGKIVDEAGGSGVNLVSAAYAVTDPYQYVQPSGHVALKPDGSFSFTVQLQASRLGSDLDGRRYIVQVTADDNAGNKGASAASVIVPHDQRR